MRDTPKAGQEALIESLTISLDSVSSKLSMTIIGIKHGSDEHKALLDIRELLDSVKSRIGSIADTKTWRQIHARVDRLDSSLSALEKSTQL